MYRIETKIVLKIINIFITLRVQLLGKVGNHRDSRGTLYYGFPVKFDWLSMMITLTPHLLTSGQGKEMDLQTFSQFKLVQTILSTLYVAPEIFPSVVWVDGALLLSIKYRSTYERRDIFYVLPYHIFKSFQIKHIHPLQFNVSAIVIVTMYNFVGRRNMGFL